MIFSELYGTYYNTVAAILRQAARHPITKEELRTIIKSCAFSESVLSIEPSLTGGKWQLMEPDGTTPTRHPPTMPLTMLQKRWLKVISLDPRIRLFDFDVSGLEDVPPLFTPDDIYLFDRYADGDPFEDETYIQTFHLILDAIKNRYPLSIDVKNRRETRTHLNVMPEYLEYSEKDDKFRLITSGCRYGKVVNLGRILSCKPFQGDFRRYQKRLAPAADNHIVIELYDGRNALERVLLHFAHFEKEAQRLDERHYRITINYQRNDETELVIRVLSFGPFIKVTEPESFVELIKKRLEMQKSCELI
ncbi:WYL domain-containing protein [Caproiciproducens sp.]|uniref:WYL domain-containing protein n=1 Tax=Caproiciproducens sp. TaxID=1954376 RepID=UPI00289A8EBB|nr:WYL domain-containing protein [Caproiciproducens sp.]